MKKFEIDNINTADYWNDHQTATDFGLRQQKYLDLAGEGFSITEVGCGLSPFLNEARKKFKIALGFDFSPKTIEVAKKQYPNVIYNILDVKDLDLLSEHSIDVVVAGEIIEHLEDPDKFLDDLERVALFKVIISTPILEFNDPEHLWQFAEHDFINRGYTTEVVESERFKGRKYIFAYKNL